MKDRIDIAISSGKGGTGKTFIATNLAKLLSRIIGVRSKE